MKKFKLFLLGAVCAFFLTNCSTKDEVIPEEKSFPDKVLSVDKDNPYIIRTRTRKNDGTVLENVKVRLLNPSNPALNDSVFTDGMGIGELPAYDTGDFTLHFIKTGYLDKWVYLNIQDNVDRFDTLTAN